MPSPRVAAFVIRDTSFTGETLIRVASSNRVEVTASTVDESVGNVWLSTFGTSRRIDMRLTKNEAEQIGLSLIRAAGRSGNAAL